MNADVDVKLLQKAETLTKDCESRSIPWKRLEYVGAGSVSDSLQLSSDRYQLSLSAWFLKFYPLRAKLLKFSERLRSHHILKSSATVGLIPV